MRVNKSTGEIYIYDAIGQDWFGGGITADAVIAALGDIGNKRALIRINSPGGVADEGIAIYNALRRHTPGVDVVVDSLAASAASIVALAGEKRTTAVGGKWMIHRAMTVGVGNSLDMTKLASILDKYDSSLVEIYQRSMMVDQATIMDLMTEETWYTADEAIAAGLSTGKEDVQASAPNVANWFKNPPKNLMESAQSKSFAVKRMAAELKCRTFR